MANQYTKPIDLKTAEGRHRFYQTKAWKILRQVVLTEQPYCVECLKKGIKELANEVDHIKELKDNTTRCLDITNCQSLCKSCHSKKTYTENNDSSMFNKKQKFIVVNRKWNFDTSIGKAAEVRT